jgi:two-component system KDP operon response regulator KdpE
MIRVLVVNPRPDVAQGLAAQLGLAGHQARASSSQPALVARSLAESHADVVVLDAVPEKELDALIRLVKQESGAEMIVLTGEYSEDGLERYLGQGVTYYLRKPASLRGLNARVKALGMRTAAEGEDVTGSGDIDLDAANQAVRYNGTLIQLTAHEFRLLSVLLENRGKACSHRSLLQAAWGSDFEDHSHYLRIYIGLLRRKLEPNPRRPRLIVTVWGQGYRLAEPMRPSRAASARQVSRGVRASS